MSRSLTLFLTLTALVACGGSEDAGTNSSDSEDDGGGMVQVDPPDPTWQSGVDSGDTGGDDTCGPTELCTRSIDECGVAMDLGECESWYDLGDCRDMDAYIACNCDCIGQAECDGYFACGELCYEDHCL